MLGVSQSPVQSDTWSTYIRLGRVPYTTVAVSKTAYWLHFSKAKVLPAGPSSGSGVEAPAENFSRAGEADGLTGWGGVAVVGLRRRWRRGGAGGGRRPS